MRHSSSSSLAIDWQPEGWRDVTILWPHQTHSLLLPAHRFVDLQKTLATSDGHPCCGLGRISKCVQMLTGRDQHPGSQSLCWITIERARRWFNRKISWLFFFLSMASRIQKTTSSPNLQKYLQTDIFIWMCAFGHLTKPNSTSWTKQRKTTF